MVVRERNVVQVRGASRLVGFEARDSRVGKTA